MMRFKNQCIGDVLVIAPVDDIKKHSGVFLVENAAANLINNQTRGLDQSVDNRAFPAILSCIMKPLVQLCSLEKVCFQSVFAAQPAESHSKMGLSNTGRADKCQVLTGI